MIKNGLISLMLL